ncbi:unnamed protein product [Brachionus calyciflorus]|uniref:Reverse transcriptase domain-containing protein n=1 Tax=Brachionus calyciflorus TaxID=104777 RepID=A0A813SLB8_9BILA|nr:unnamed protein product [Brachionus calyciflorus]
MRKERGRDFSRTGFVLSTFCLDAHDEIEKEEPGLKISYRENIDGIAYADDIVLKSTTKKGLQEQIDITERYGYEIEINYNPSKTTYMVFNEDLILNGSTITQVESMKYLGVNISDDDKNTVHIVRFI